jgi:anti-sigma B factor antagonist
MTDGTRSERRAVGRAWTSPPLRMHIESGPASVCLKVGGELDIYTAPDLEEAIEQLEATVPALLIVDLADLDFIDATGLHILLEAHKRARNTNRCLFLLRPRPMVQRVLQVTGLDKVLDLPRVWPARPTLGQFPSESVPTALFD